MTQDFAHPDGCDRCKRIVPLFFHEPTELSLCERCIDLADTEQAMAEALLAEGHENVTTLTAELDSFAVEKRRENYVCATTKAADGGTVRLWSHGMVDAIDGDIYELSPGFDSLDEFEAWLAEEIEKRDAANERVGRWYWTVEITVSGRIVAKCPGTGEIREVELDGPHAVERGLRALGRTIDNDRR